jgi:hypothetical protein
VFPPVPGPMPTKLVLRKIAYDQSILAPWFIVMFNYVMMGFEGKTHREANIQIQNDFWFTYMYDLMFWPTISFFNFKYIPINYQPSVIYSASLIWTGIMSYIYNRDK